MIFKTKQDCSRDVTAGKILFCAVSVILMLPSALSRPPGEKTGPRPADGESLLRLPKHADILLGIGRYSVWQTPPVSVPPQAAPPKKPLAILGSRPLSRPSGLCVPRDHSGQTRRSRSCKPQLPSRISPRSTPSSTVTASKSCEL